MAKKNDRSRTAASKARAIQNRRAAAMKRGAVRFTASGRARA